jgi:thiosulfate/3-mercaptopyruvate sulfurtransferase
MLRWMGHDQVAVLDGGLKAFVAAGGKLSTDVPSHAPAVFVPNLRPEMQAGIGEVATRGANVSLIDSRAPSRYAGLEEPIDPVAGHIPGAINRNWADSLDGDGKFKGAEAQEARFAELTDEKIVYCGSGVSACANLLAMEVAGIKGAKLYVGSWSEWSSDKGRPVAKGD